ncbi:unnamed protein product [Jaminaea pallidilutea]
MPSSELDGFIASWVIVKRQFITYRLLSREKGIHVQKAAEALQAFCDANKDSTRAVYVVQGTLLPKRQSGVNGSQSMDVDGQDDGEEIAEDAIQLVGEDKLQETLSRFADNASHQIYSVFPCDKSNGSSSSSKSLNTTDLASMSTVPLMLASEPRYVQAWEKANRGRDLGVLYNDRVRPGDPRAIAAAKQQAEMQAKQQAQAAANTESAAKKEGDAKAVPPKTAAGGKPGPANAKKAEAAADQPKKGAGGLNWGKAKPPQAPAAKPKTESAKRAGKEEEDDDENSDVEMAQIGYADSDEDKDTETRAGGSTNVKRADAVVPPPAAKSSGRAETIKSSVKSGDKSASQREEDRRKLREMMEVEEDTVEDRPGEGDPPDVPMKEAATTSMMEGGGEQAQESEAEEAANKPEQTAQSKERRKVRRKRRTVKKVSGKDAKGYRFTREVSDYESYSDWTDSEEAKLQPSTSAAAAKKAGGGKKGGTQASKPPQPPPQQPRQSTGGGSKASSKEPSPTKPACNDGPKSSGPTAASGGSGAGSGPKKGGGAGGGAAGGQSKLSSFFKKG